MSATEKSKKPHKKHIADVHEPGTAAPSPTSKPVLVSNRPLLKDPMVVDESESSEAPAELSKGSPKLSAADKPTIQPLNPNLAEEIPDEEAPPTEAAAKPAEGPVVPDAMPEATDEPDESEADPEARETATDGPETPPASTPPETGGQPAKPAAPKTDELEAAERAQREAAIQELADSKKYALAIRTTEQRNSKRVVVLGTALSVVLLLLWLNVALDAGIIRVDGVDSLTNFFPN